MHVRESAKETADSIIVAFILAFVFRAFIVEAFVIPTGSMAATLYGKHGTITCVHCGWEFAYGLADQSEAALTAGSARAIKPQDRVPCQNCGYPNTDLKINDVAGNRGNAESGDRILVLKWPFDLGLESIGPQRWDVTVFKNPTNGSQNFIKRLLGLPGEVLEIIDGDVYTAPTDKLTEPSRRALELQLALKLARQSGSHPEPSVSQELSGLQEGLFEELDEKLRICRKTARAQGSLWTVVYDHDYPPQQADAARRPSWQPADPNGSAWQTSNRKLTCRNTGGRADELVFSGKSLDDVCAYNVGPVGSRRPNPVSDLQLRLVLVPQSGPGSLELTLFKHEDQFTARIGMDGRAALYANPGPGRPEQEPLSARLLSPLVIGQPVELRFQNVDHRVSLEVDGEEVLATADEQYTPNIRARRRGEPGPTAPPRIGAVDLEAELWHVVLNRDVYYSSMQEETGRLGPCWGTTGRPIWLREGEFFMLGDNSQASADSRLWDHVGPHLSDAWRSYQLGTVPKDQLIGRAFFVYWPAAHRSDLIPFLREWGVIPNFGRMRWIR